jgi:dTDP-4-dehydrorhamnose 3,5-epimerase
LVVPLDLGSAERNRMTSLLSGCLSIADIAVAYSDKVTTQEYSKKQGIDGVRVIDLRLMSDDGGMFAEVARFDQSGCLEAVPEFQVRQTSYSVVLPGAIKAFHLHFRQDDVWFVPPTDRLLVGLIDIREKSESTGATTRLVLGSGKAQLLFIPRGVAHGVANIWNEPGTVFYFVNQQFDINDPDERRLPYDTVDSSFWQITPG